MNIQLLSTAAHLEREGKSLNAPKDKRLMNSQPQNNQQGPANSSSNPPAPTSQMEAIGNRNYENRSD